jgi:hypothetical protein
MGCGPRLTRLPYDVLRLGAGRWFDPVAIWMRELAVRDLCRQRQDCHDATVTRDLRLGERGAIGLGRADPGGAVRSLR